MNQDSYFLGSDFRALYKPTEKKNTYVPIDRTLTALHVKSNITFPALWGTRQNIPEGRMIMIDKGGAMWGVHKQSFFETYEPVCDSTTKLSVH